MTAQRLSPIKRLTANYWFFPLLFSLGAVALAVIVIALDRSGAALGGIGRLLPDQPEEAAEQLTVITGSMIGVAATVFSITIAAVAYVSGQYGPRLLVNFLENRGNQLSLATFFGTFFYAIILLRVVRSDAEAQASAASTLGNAAPTFTPQLSLLIAYLLLALCVGVLIYFLNHIPSSIRIQAVLEGIGSRLIEAIRDVYPVEDERGEAREAMGGDDVAAWDAGYVQSIDFAQLEAIALEHGCTFSLTVRTGDFVHRDLPLLQTQGCTADRVAALVRDCFHLGPSRLAEPDPQFLMGELVEIGLRALSPGINDPLTATTALHWLGAATAETGRRDLRKDLDGSEAEDCPVIPRADDFDHYVERGFGSIRSAAAAHATAAKTMLEAIENAALPIQNPQRRGALRKEADALLAQARETLAEADLAALETRYAEFETRVPASQIRAA